MTTPTQKTNVSEQAREYLPGQFLSATAFKAFCDVLTGPVQAIEDALWDLLTKRFRTAATGKQLDVLGEHVGLTRQGASDNAYGAAIMLQIAINASQGDPERLIAISKVISKASFIHYQQHQPGVALLYCHTLCDWLLLWKVQRAAAGGVNVVVTGSVDDDVFVFGPDRDASGNECGVALSYGSGFGETT